jgi:type IV pilus assembly protein PilQ
MTDEDLVAELNREKLKQSLEKMEPPITRVIKIDYADSKILKDSLLSFLDKKQSSSPAQQASDKVLAIDAESSTITVDTHTNSLVIRATRQEMSKILPVIEALDRPTPQIQIKAHIVETNQAIARELGAKWGSEGGDFTAGMDLSVSGGGFIGYATTHGRSTLSLELSALESEGKLKILSNPSITTIDNKKAMIESGKEIPYQSIEDGEISVQYKKAVIHLEVTPHVIDKDLLRLIISTSKDEIDNSVEVNGNPGIITKKAETEVVLYNGSTTVIGGLNKDRDEKNIKGIPYLMDIPVIGHLFRWDSDSREMEELLIFITPQILGERTAKEAKETEQTAKDGPVDEKETR